MSSLPYTSYADFIARYFNHKMQKLPVDVGFTCPVRDGLISVGGCDFCNGRSFVPDMCSSINSVSSQLEKGKTFFRRKYKNDDVGFLAYFQAGSNTYAPLAEAEKFFVEALSCPQIEGLVIATRPDCLPDEWLDALAKWSEKTFVMVELGIESVNDYVLRRVSRGHTVETSEKAVLDLADRGIHVGVHTILGLPGETETTMLHQADWLSQLPVSVVKLHQLQILKGAAMAADYRSHPEQFHLFTLDEYVSLVADFIERLAPEIALERFVSQSPSGSLIAPRWGVKNDVVSHRIVDELHQRGTCQGCRNTREVL